MGTLTPAGSKLSAAWVDNSGKDHTVVLNGDMYGVSANIEYEGKVLGHIGRKLVTATDMVADKQTVSEPSAAAGGRGARRADWGGRGMCKGQTAYGRQG